MSTDYDNFKTFMDHWSPTVAYCVTYARGRTSVEIQQWRPLLEPVISRYNKGSFTSHTASSVPDMVAASPVQMRASI